MTTFSLTRQRAKRTSTALGLILVAALSTGSSATAGSGGAGLVSTSSGVTVRAVFARTLRVGSSGSDVQQLQTWLSELGYAVAVTGQFGSETKAAVRQFQRTHHLSPASGSVGNRTASVMLAAVRKLGHVNVTSSKPLDPIPGFRTERDDMGVDAGARPGAPIYAPLASRLSQVMRDWYAGEPLLLYKFVQHPPGALSDYWYVAEQVNPVTTRIGTLFPRGARVGTFASSGTDIEIGWGSPTSWSRTLASATDPGSAHPRSGSKTRWGESFKSFFGIR
jgi:peptidoglycan hydrolase-like protein with peptidoglycan-binding domain